MPKLWSDLNFTGAGKPVTLGAVRKYIKRAQGTVTRVTLDRFGANIEKVPRYITSRCNRLQELRIPAGYMGSSILEAAPCATNLKILIISSQCHVTCDTASQLLHHCANLERAEFWSVSPVGQQWNENYLPQLHSLTLRCASLFGGSNRPEEGVLLVNELLPTIPNVRRLNLPNWQLATLPQIEADFSVLKHLETLDIPRLAPNRQGVGHPILPCSLNSLDMGKSVLNTTLTRWNGSPNSLVRLSVANMTLLSFSQLSDWLKPNKGNLTYLDIGGCLFSVHELLELVEEGFLDKIQDLKLNCFSMNDTIAISLSENTNVLKTLHLANTMVTGVGVKALVTKLQGILEYLNLDNCKSMGIDAVAWARSMGVRVAFSLADDSRNGKKIRTRDETIGF